MLHQCPITANEKSLCVEYEQSIIDYHLDRAQSYFEKQIELLASEVFKYSEISFHLILFPIPNKKEIVEKFVETAENYQKQ